MTTSERTALYRFYAADDTLLYVGITNDFGVRWTSHAKLKPWWPEAQRHTAEWFSTRPEAAAAEKRAIRDERPKYNITHRPEPARPVDAAASAPPARPARAIPQRAGKPLTTSAAAVGRARAVLRRAEEREAERTAVLHDLVADVCPDADELQAWGGSPRGWKKQASAGSGYSGQGITNIAAAVRAARAEAGQPVRRIPRDQAMAQLAAGRAELERAATARERARAAYYRAIAEAMPRRAESGRASGADAAALRELREATGYGASQLRRIQDQVATEG